MIHKSMEEFYVFVSSENSLNHFGNNSGGQFLLQFLRMYPMKDKWECALLDVSFASAFETHTRRVYVCGDFVGNYSYVRNSYQPVLQSVSILHEEVMDVTFERPTYHETKPFQFYQLEITLNDDRLRVCRFKDDHVFVCFISVNDNEEFIRGSDWTGKPTDMQCPVCQREFSRRDNMLRHHRNVHAGGNRRGRGGSGRGGRRGG
jgi:hypothetical protein